MSRSNDIANITSSVLDGVTKAEVGLGNVDNTADTAKPVSTAQQSAIDLKANIASPTFTGNVALGSNASGTFTGTIGSSVVFPAGGTGNPISVAMVADESSTGSNGGTASSFAELSNNYIVRNLDTEIYDPDGIVSLSSNQFTLGAGTYLLNFSAPAYKVDRHQAHIYDVTGTAILQEGQNQYCSNADNTQTTSTGFFIHTISSNNVYELRHYVEYPRSSNGLGVSSLSSTSRTSVYCYVIIYKLK